MSATIAAALHRIGDGDRADRRGGTEKKPNIVAIMGDDTACGTSALSSRSDGGQNAEPRQDRQGRDAVWRFVFVQQLMAKEIQTFLDFPPMQRGASFNLDAIKVEMQKKMEEAEKATRVQQ